jgi:hypothetical protein
MSRTPALLSIPILLSAWLLAETASKKDIDV